MWGLWPPVPLVDEVHHVVHVDGIHLHRDAVCLSSNKSACRHQLI